jgi:hypothetical protein
MKTIQVSVFVSVRTNKSSEIIHNRAAEANFYVFRYNFACRPSILISKRLADPQSMLVPNLFRFLEFSLLKASKAVKTTFRPVCV